eukprot:1158921-Pelagomonas_calceolata.AAC.13
MVVVLQVSIACRWHVGLEQQAGGSVQETGACEKKWCMCMESANPGHVGGLGHNDACTTSCQLRPMCSSTLWRKAIP